MYIKKNNIIKKVIIYKITTLSYFNFILTLSINKGWIVTPLFYLYNKHIENILFGFIRLFKFNFKLKGFGFKWKYLINCKKQQLIFFKVGFTHKIILLIKKDSKYELKKQKILVKNRSYFFLRNYLNFLFILYKKNLYNKKGLYLKGTQFNLKLSKKKAKF